MIINFAISNFISHSGQIHPSRPGNDWRYFDNELFLLFNDTLNSSFFEKIFWIDVIYTLMGMKHNFWNEYFKLAFNWLSIFARNSFSTEFQISGKCLKSVSNLKYMLNVNLPNKFFAVWTKCRLTQKCSHKFVPIDLFKKSKWMN